MRGLARWAQVVLVADAVAFLIGAGQHGVDLATRGVLPYPEVGIAINLYWSALAVVDPVTAALLLWRPRVGLVLALSVMATDLAANAYAVLTVFGASAAGGLVRLAAFTAFLTVTAPLVWRAASPRAVENVGRGTLYREKH